MAVGLEQAMQDAKMSTHFHRQETWEEQRCRRQLSSSAVGRAGGAGQLMLTAKIIGEHSTKLNEFNQSLNQAVEKGNLTKIYQVWHEWVGDGNGDVPLDNREMHKVRTEAVRIGIRRLRAAVNARDGGQLRRCVEIVDLAMTRWPWPKAIQASLEYQAAVRQIEEGLEEWSEEDAAIASKAEAAKDNKQDKRDARKVSTDHGEESHEDEPSWELKSEDAEAPSPDRHRDLDKEANSPGSGSSQSTAASPSRAREEQILDDIDEDEAF